MFGNAIAALEAFAAGGGTNFTAAAAELHEQFKKVFVGLLSEGGFLYCDRFFFYSFKYIRKETTRIID